jgi:hypothetical protein
MTTDQKRSLLINYLNLYLSKRNLEMKPVIKDIQKRLKTNELITLKQFNSVIKFLEREPELRPLGSRSNIHQFFSSLIIQTKTSSEINTSNTLEHILY